MCNWHHMVERYQGWKTDGHVSFTVVQSRKSGFLLRDQGGFMNVASEGKKRRHREKLESEHG